MNTHLPFYLHHIFFILTATFFTQAIASEITPFYSRNQSPFIHIFGLPTAQPGTLIPVGKIDTRTIFEVINNYTRDQRPQQRIIIDGETYRTTFLLRWGLSEKLEAGIDLPYLTHDQGFLDNFIEDWHNVFGFSNKKRQEVGKNRLDYSVKFKEEQRVFVNRHETGPGDILLSLAFPLSFSKNNSFQAIALRTGLKLPSGNPNTLHGSGSTDVYFSVNASDKAIELFWPLKLYGGLGLLLTGNSKILEDWQRHHVFFGNVGIGGHFGKWVDLKLQTDAQTAFYENPSQQLGVFSAQLIMGGTLNLPHQIYFDLGVSEDIIKDTAPDLIFHFALRRQF